MGAAPRMLACQRASFCHSLHAVPVYERVRLAHHWNLRIASGLGMPREDRPADLFTLHRSDPHVCTASLLVAVDKLFGCRKKCLEYVLLTHRVPVCEHASGYGE